MGRTFLLATAITVLFAGTASAEGIGCCLEGCGADPAWNSCANGTTCTGGVCNSDIGSSVTFTTDPCGEGGAASCPKTEAGQCADGVNNDVWTNNSKTDCADEACLGDPACAARAPVAGPLVLAALAVALALGGAVVLKRRAHG